MFTRNFSEMDNINYKFQFQIHKLSEHGIYNVANYHTFSSVIYDSKFNNSLKRHEIK